MPASSKPALPLIIGAGPAGLTTALMLARAGIAARIVDKSAGPAKESRALLINHQTLDALEATGVSERLIAAGNQVKSVVLRINGKVRAHVSFDQVPHKHQFLLIVPQSTTERILIEAFAAMGGHVERGTRFENVWVEKTGIDVQLVNGASRETTRVSWLVGADGAHSDVRKTLGIEFPGAHDEHDWSLVDLDLDGDVPDDQVELNLSTDGLILIRFPFGDGRHRVISNELDVLEHIPEEWGVGDIHWEADFFVSHCMSERRRLGRAVLIGDAAHTHSPIGGRGLNLGIEDGVALAALISATPNLDPALITKRILEDNKVRLRQWEQARLSRTRHILAFSSQLHAIASQHSGLVSRLLPLAMSLVNVTPPLEIFMQGLMSDLEASV